MQSLPAPGRSYFRFPRWQKSPHELGFSHGAEQHLSYVMDHDLVSRRDATKEKLMQDLRVLAADAEALLGTLTQEIADRAQQARQAVGNVKDKARESCQALQL